MEEMALGPSVVVPPEHMTKPSDAHETAAALEIAKHRLQEIRPADGQITPPTTPPQTNFTDQHAFAFDIDGVLIRGGKPIPQAVEAMKVLNGQNQYGVKVYAAIPSRCMFVTHRNIQAVYIRYERWWKDGAREMS
ncbi:MAG: hypothetical protein Q9225_003417 [Loekoesia sp. 1 TL-2023]